MFEIYDIGYKRSSKPEWIQFFSTAKAVIYVADLTDYDRVVMVNRKRKNKMVRYDTIICNNRADGTSHIFQSFIFSSICRFSSLSIYIFPCVCEWDVCLCMHIYVYIYYLNSF